MGIRLQQAETCYLTGGPVFHLQVDVGVVVGVPWSVDLPVPYPLQVGRQPGWGP